MPVPLVIAAWAWLWLSGISGMIIAADLVRRPQQMWIMGLVWPITALYAGPLALVMYFRYGVLSSRPVIERHGHPGHRPFPVTVALAATHCGAGCTLGDLIAEWGVFFIPALAGFALHRRLFNAWILDYILAYLFGIVFQYFTIAPMRNLRGAAGVWAAIKADTLSLTAWQIGMYGWMALVVFVFFGHEIRIDTPVFWFMMQVGMLCGFVVAYPVNWWLIRAGLKEKM